MNLAISKNNLVSDLTRRELALQAILMDKDKLPAVRMAEYKKAWAEMQETRKAFTNRVDGALIQPLMMYEKRTDPKTNEQFMELSQQEFSERKKAVDDLEKQQELAREVAAFKAHFQNEFERLAHELRSKWSATISQAYRDCLYAKTPPDALPIDLIKAALADHKIGAPEKFKRTLIDEKMAPEIYKGILKPQLDIQEAYDALEEKFSLYPQDLQRAEAAAEEEAQAQAAESMRLENDLQKSQAANTLIAAAETMIIAPEGFKGITETTKIKIVEHSEAWTLKIMAAFMANAAAVFPKVKNKTFSTINITQMAMALDNAGVKVNGIEYEKIEK